MTTICPMPRSIESRQDLESLVPGDQIYFYIGFRQAWAVYEGRINDKMAFMVRSEDRKDARSYRVMPENVKICKEGSIRINHCLGNFQIIKYHPLEAFPQKLNMLREAGL